MQDSILNLISSWPVGSDSMMNKLKQLKQRRGRWEDIFYLALIIMVA